MQKETYLTKLISDEEIELKDLAGCDYCNYPKKKEDCTILDCANYHLQFHFYLRWYKWIRGMIKQNNLDESDLANLLNLNELEWKEFISGHINPFCYKNHNYLEDILYHMGCTTDDVSNLNIRNKFLMRYRIKLLNLILV